MTHWIIFYKYWKYASSSLRLFLSLLLIPSLSMLLRFLSLSCVLSDCTLLPIDESSSIINDLVLEVVVLLRDVFLLLLCLLLTHLCHHLLLSCFEFLMVRMIIVSFLDAYVFVLCFSYLKAKIIRDLYQIILFRSRILE